VRRAAIPTAGWTAAEVPDQTGRTALVTGANSGVGLEVARVLTERGARVLLACRDRAKATAAAHSLNAGGGAGWAEVVVLDLADLDSVGKCATDVMRQIERLDILAMNAGVMDMPRSTTVDGFEIHLGTNHLGHFAFAAQVAPLLLAPPETRVVVTSSLMHHAGRLRWNDPNWTGRAYSASLAYAQSKLANLLFMRELDRRARAGGSALLSVAGHPGSADTNLATQNPSRISRVVYDAVHRYGAQPARAGALPLLYAMTMPVHGGSYWGPSGPLGLFGPPGASRMSRAARDTDAARRLWTLSEELTGTVFATS
jgi:NAD(P)-dependent dehydrogenase (short-subunit alcohol dehydrogenase family)